MHAYFVTLNWNTTDLCSILLSTVEAMTPEPHTWIIIDNGSVPDECTRLLESVGARFPGGYQVCTATDTSARVGAWGKALVVLADENMGCVKGHNLAFDMVDRLRKRQPAEIVMFDTDVEVAQPGWLTAARDFASKAGDVGIVGLEHSPAEACAGAVFLDPSGNWYLHAEQTMRPVPVRAESVGLGMALLRAPVVQAGLRFDEGFKLYYKQDDDLCFQCRANLGLDVWAYPIAMTHWGSQALRANAYAVDKTTPDREAFDAVKRANQKYFAQKWAWALRGRRPTLAAETAHLAEMDALMRERRLDAGLYQ